MEIIKGQIYTFIIFKQLVFFFNFAPKIGNNQHGLVFAIIFFQKS